MKRSLCCLLLLAASGMIPAPNAGASSAQAHTDAIYGKDDRIDVYQAAPRLQAAADSTVALFRDYDVALDASGTRANLKTLPLGPSMALCPTERFYDQPVGAFCSGFLIGDGIVATAGHCVTSQSDCEHVRFVFGFSVQNPAVMPTSMPASEVYGCSKLIRRAQDNQGADYALVQLDRPVAGHQSLQVDTSDSLQVGSPLVLIGHPTGLPTKIAGNASVRSLNNGYFVSNVDAFAGNSGSAVLDARTGLVEGILVRGEGDYTLRGSCLVPIVCPDNGCAGEDATRMSSVFASGVSFLAPARVTPTALVPPIQNVRFDAEDIATRTASALK